MRFDYGNFHSIWFLQMDFAGLIAAGEGGGHVGLAEQD